MGNVAYLDGSRRGSLSLGHAPAYCIATKYSQEKKETENCEVGSGGTRGQLGLDRIIWTTRSR